METLPTIFENDDMSEIVTKLMTETALDDNMSEIVTKLNMHFLNISQRMKNINEMFIRLYERTHDTSVGMTFLEHELLEERMDQLLYMYSKSKELMKQGRLIRHYKELKESETEKLNELRIARNTLAQYGIHP